MSQTGTLFVESAAKMAEGSYDEKKSSDVELLLPKVVAAGPVRFKIEVFDTAKIPSVGVTSFKEYTPKHVERKN